MKSGILSKALICIELVLFSYFMLSSEQGLKVVWHANHTVDRLTRKINMMRAEITQLTNELESWRTESTHQERVARCQLGLSREGERIYYINSESS